uniref:CKLF-like MARVEL transmembrane domain containing 3 n=1 Tax=Callorhinchus milii TaxID=7868 RepID=A0A4W3J1M7_CALMI
MDIKILPPHFRCWETGPLPPYPHPHPFDFIPKHEGFVCVKPVFLPIYQILSFIIFICYLASSSASFMAAPLIEFLLSLCAYYLYATKYIERFTSFHWPFVDFLRCVTAAIIFFAISMYAVTKGNDAASKAAGVFGFAATIVFAFDFYYIFNNLAGFLHPQELPTHNATISKSTGGQPVY